MKKRMLSILLALCMVICLVPTSVFAAGETTKKVETEQELVDALADSTVDIITLKSDIAVSSTLIVKRAVTLDIYGYMLEISGSGSVIKVEDGGHLTLEDSDPKALYKFTPDANGLWKWVASGGTKAVRGGVIYGGNAVYGGGVHIEAGGRFTMNGGSIVGCQASRDSSGNGGGVFVAKGGAFEMNDGATIIGCVAVDGYGGGVYCEDGFTMNGGTIRDCTAFNAGAIDYRGEAPLTLNGTVIAGSKDITGNPNPAITGTTINTDSLPNSSKVGDLILGDKANIQADMSISRGTVHANGGVVRGNVHSYRELTFSVDEGVTGSTIIYGQIRGWYITIDGPAMTYQVNGKDYATQILRSGAAATKPDDPAAEDGYVFAGWYKGDTPYDFTSPVTEDITLAAKWAKLVDKTADFTASDGGAEAIALLNSAKNGAEDSTWDNGTKTLTLKGVSMATTATTAVKLPDGATVILADGTENHIIGGGAAAAEDGDYNNKIYVYGIYAAGALTVQGEANGTGTLFVNSGDHINSGDAWTYSAALYADGNLTVKGGALTAQGGKTSSADCAFSLGVQLSEGHSLSVSGGTLTAIGGESFDTEDPNDVTESFSEGIEIYRGNVTISGSGKLIVKTVSDMMEKGLSFGLYIMQGSLSVSDSAALTAKTSQAIRISGGDLKLSGGKIYSYATSDSAAVSVVKEMFQNSGNGNIEITGGEFECVGGIYMDQSSPANNQGVFSVTAGELTANSIYGPAKLTISGGTVTSGHIDADTVELQNGSLTVRELVYKNEYTNVLYASRAICCKELTVSGGTLDAAWDWGEHTPTVFPADSYWDYAEPLIKVLNGTSSFSGGTVILDTGCAGNTAIKTEKLNLSGGVRGSGYTNEDGSDTYIQSDGSTPVKFTVYPADYSKVDAAIAKANGLNKDDYKDFSAVEAAVNAVARDKNLDEQVDVDAMAKAINDAIAALEYKDADYSKVDAAIARANALNKDDYKDFSAVEAAISAVVRGKNITEQAAVDAMAQAIEDAINALEYKDADYSKVNAAITRANALNKDDYKDFSAVEAAISTVVRGKNITEQAAVDAMAQAIEDAINALEKKPVVPDPEPGEPSVEPGEPSTQPDDQPRKTDDSAPKTDHKSAKTPVQSPKAEAKSPQTGAADPALLGLVLLFISGGACTVCTVKRKKSHLHGGHAK